MALPHLILSDAHSTSVGYSFPTAVANLCVTKDIFAGKYFSYNYIELTKQFLMCGLFVSFFCSAGYICQKNFQIALCFSPLCQNRFFFFGGGEYSG